MGENYNAKYVEIRQNRLSGIRLSGVPPIPTINNTSKNIERTVLMGENDNANFVEIRQNIPS